MVGSSTDKTNASREADVLAKKEKITAFPTRAVPPVAEAPMPAQAPSRSLMVPAVPIRGNRDFLSAVPIEVLNGNGVQNMAGRVRDYLESNGYTVAKISNADHFNHPRTVIYHQPGYLPVAKDVAATMPGASELREMPLMGPVRSVRVKVIIGRDLIRFDMASFQARKQG